MSDHKLFTGFGEHCTYYSQTMSDHKLFTGFGEHCTYYSQTMSDHKLFTGFGEHCTFYSQTFLKRLYETRYMFGVSDRWLLIVA